MSFPEHEAPNHHTVRGFVASQPRTRPVHTPRPQPATSAAYSQHMAGRPSDIDKIIRTVDGRDITVADRIVASIEAGAPVRIAAREAGTTTETYAEWRRVAAAALIRCGGNDNDRSITAHERRCIAFSDQVDEARARWAINQNRILERDAREGRTKTKTVEELDPRTGEVVSRTTTTEVLPPDAASIRWRLGINFPDEYAPADRVEVSGADGGPVELSLAERASALTELVRKVRAAKPPAKAKRTRKPAVVETQSRRAKRAPGP